MDEPLSVEPQRDGGRSAAVFRELVGRLLQKSMNEYRSEASQAMHQIPQVHPPRRPPMTS